MPAAPGGAPPPRREMEEERTRAISLEHDDDEVQDITASAPAADAPESVAAPAAQGFGRAAPPAEEPEDKPKKKSFIRGAIDALFGQEEAKKADAPNVVRGRVVSRKGKEIVIDIEVLQELDWDDAALAAAIARVWFDDGTEIGGKVDVSKTSASARLKPGQHVKLVILMDEEPTRAARFVRFDPDLGLFIPLA